jgi:hypothetical protein
MPKARKNKDAAPNGAASLASFTDIKAVCGLKISLQTVL